MSADGYEVASCRHFFLYAYNYKRGCPYGMGILFIFLKIFCVLAFPVRKAGRQCFLLQRAPGREGMEWRLGQRQAVRQEPRAEPGCCG